MIWREIRIKDIGRVITGTTPPTAEKKYFDGKYPFIKPSDLNKDERIPSFTEMTISEEGLDYFPKNLLPKHTSCVVTIGTIGKLCFTDKPSFTNQQINSVIPNQNLFDNHFVYYLLMMHIPSVKVLNGGSASGRENVNKSSFSNIKVKVPDLLTQKKIGSILSSYDELIENNKQRIKLLEEMAEEIYIEWFVRLRFPGYEKTKIVDGLPEGWKMKSINSFVNIISGYAFKTEAFDNEGIYKLVTIKNVQDGFFVTQTTDYIYELPKNLKEDCKLKDKDIILSLTGNIGRICMVYGENYLLNQRVAKLKPKQENYFEFVYLMFRSSFLRATLENLSNGAAQQNLSPIEMGKLEFPIPTDDIIDILSKTTKSFFDEIITLNKKNQLLQETRDVLLPRLISGKLSVEHLLDEKEDLLMVAEPNSDYSKSN